RRDAGRGALHRVPARLRARRGVPARVRVGGEERGGVGGLLRALPRGRERGGVSGGGARLAGGEGVTAATRAEVCAVAVAECFRGDGERLASCFGTVPAIGARLARLTFPPDMMMTDGVASLVADVVPV